MVKTRIHTAVTGIFTGIRAVSIQSVSIQSVYLVISVSQYTVGILGDI